MRAFVRALTLVAIAAGAVLVPASAAHANIVMNTSMTWPTGAGVGTSGLAGSFTVQNSNTAPQQSDTLRVTVLRVAPSCGAVRSGADACPSPDPGAYTLSSPGSGASGTACAGITFSVSAPDAIGAVTLTPSSAVVLQPPGGPAGSDRCTVNVQISVAKVPSIDVDVAAPGVQTWTNLFVQATSSPSNLTLSTGPSLESTINQGIPGLTTAASVVPPGNAVADTATLTGAGNGPLPTGSVTFHLFGPDDTSCTGTAQTSTKTVSNGTATATFPASAVGVYRFTVSYSGDANYLPRLAQCNDPGESVTVSSSTAPPTIVKSFQAASVPLNQSIALTFTLSNPNAGTALTGVAFTDTLPAGLIVASPNGLSGSCGGGTITATPGSSTLSLSGATLSSSASCTFSAKVTATTAGQKTNTVTVTSANAGTGNTSNASLTVVAPPTIAKAFAATPVPFGATTTLTFSLANPNAGTALHGVGFTDNLPAGLVVATPSGLSGSCGGGAITAGAGSGTISLSGATLAAGTSCSFSADVTAVAVGVKKNTTTKVVSVEGGTGASASRSLTVTKARTSTAATAAPSTASAGSPVTFTGAVGPAEPNDSGINPTGTVSFFLDGQSSPVATVTMVGGQASFTTSGLGAGSHRMRIVYNGDGNFKSSSSPSPARVTVT